MRYVIYIFLLFLVSCHTNSQAVKYRKDAAKREWPFYDSNIDKVRLEVARDAVKQHNDIRTENRREDNLNNKIERILSKNKKD